MSPAQRSATLPVEEVLLEKLERQLREETGGIFEIGALLGRGGMGAVFLATEVGLGRQVALKVLPPELSAGSTSIERFKREARTGATLDHPNIVPIYRISAEGRLCWYAMKYVDGQSLAQLIREAGRVPVPRAIGVLSQVADALDFAHGRGVIHRDVKPANVLLDSRDRAYVTDFGISKARLDATLTATGAIVGTPAYMPPEQWSGQALTGASDQYAFAVMTAEVLSGHSPFQGDSVPELMRKHCTEPPDLQPVSREFGHIVEAVFTRALAKHPIDRFLGVGAFLAALRAALAEAARAPAAGQPAVSAPPESPPSFKAARHAELDRNLGSKRPAGASPAPVQGALGAKGPHVDAPSFAGLAREDRQPWRGAASVFGALVVLGAIGYVGWILNSRMAVSPHAYPVWSSSPIVGQNPTGGISHTCIVTEAGKAFCWGTGPMLQLGHGRRTESYVPLDVEVPARFAQLGAGESHTCGVASDGAVLCWGMNDHEQSGPTSKEVCGVLQYPCVSQPQTIPGLPHALHVAGGTDFTCALGADSLAYCWGSNMRAQLGHPAERTRDRIPPVGGRARPKFADLAVGRFHACGVSADGAAYCWGWNLYGQLGSRAPMEECWVGSSTHEACSVEPLRVESHVAFRTISAGTGHTCALTTDGSPFCWGYNAHGELGSGATDPQTAVPTPVAGDHHFSAIASGEHFTCGLTATGEVWCWGDNAYGQIGGDPRRLEESRVPMRIRLEGRAVSLGAGARHACAIDGSRQVFCWGSNAAGQLGDGFVSEQESAVRVRTDIESARARR